MSDLQPGDIVPMKSFTASYDGPHQVQLTFRKLSGGRKYAFMLLGAGSPEKPLDANACLNMLGWAFDPKAAEVQLRERLGRGPDCPDCGRATLPQDRVAEGFLAPCGKRIPASAIGDCCARPADLPLEGQ